MKALNLIWRITKDAVDNTVLRVITFIFLVALTTLAAIGIVVEIVGYIAQRL